MTITQLEYIVALDTYRHFGTAAEHCFVTQPTLSMQIGKLEETLGVKLFDRTKQPVMPTEIGAMVVAQARVVLREAAYISELIAEQQDTLTGELRLGIIPTLAPYLLPDLYKAFREKYPKVQLVVREAVTEDVLHELKQNRLDGGIVVTPLRDVAIREQVLFYEELFVYVSANNHLASKAYVLPADIDPNKLWLLEEGHCFRSQMLNLCELRKSSDLQFRYETGNLETLKRMVDNSDGMTILPELAVQELDATRRPLVKPLQAPVPVRQVSLITHRHHIKTKILQALQAELVQRIPAHMQLLNDKKVVEFSL